MILLHLWFYRMTIIFQGPRVVKYCDVFQQLKITIQRVNFTVLHQGCQCHMPA